MKIACIPADQEGGKLWIRNLTIEDNQPFIEYKTTYNDMPWAKTPTYPIEDGKFFVITGDDGTILYTYSSQWLGFLQE